MAGASDKKLAQRNSETLASIHKISAVVNVLTVLSLLVLRRPSNGLWYYIPLSVPSIFLQYTIEKIGRPQYTINADGYKVLVRPGDDLQQEGLTEYMFDVIYLTLLIDILMVLFGSVKVWYLLLLIPGFGLYKTKWLWSRFIPSLSRRSANPVDDESTTSGVPAKSKRQQKLEKRQQAQQQGQANRRR